MTADLNSRPGGNSRGSFATRRIRVILGPLTFSQYWGFVKKEDVATCDARDLEIGEPGRERSRIEALLRSLLPVTVTTEIVSSLERSEQVAVIGPLYDGSAPAVLDHNAVVSTEAIA